MTRYRRTPRRQGVVYGPALDDGSGTGSSLAGRLLGAAVVLGALVLMTGLTFTFLGRAQAPVAAPSPTPTDVAVLSPSPTATPTAGTTPTPEPTPEITPAPTPVPEPTPFEVEVREGPGYITFGSGWDRNQNMNNVRATFTPGGRIAWRVVTEEPVGVPTLDVRVHRLNPEEGSEQLVFEEVYEVQSQDSQVFLRRVRMRAISNEPGIYVMRYLRGDEAIAEGFFQVVADEDD